MTKNLTSKNIKKTTHKNIKKKINPIFLKLKLEIRIVELKRLILTFVLYNSSFNKFHVTSNNNNISN